MSASIWLGWQYTILGGTVVEACMNVCRNRARVGAAVRVCGVADGTGTGSCCRTNCHGAATGGRRAPWRVAQGAPHRACELWCQGHCWIFFHSLPNRPRTYCTLLAPPNLIRICGGSACQNGWQLSWLTSTDGCGRCTQLGGKPMPAAGVVEPQIATKVVVGVGVPTFPLAVPGIIRRCSCSKHGNDHAYRSITSLKRSVMPRMRPQGCASRNYLNQVETLYTVSICRLSNPQITGVLAKLFVSPIPNGHHA